MRQGGREREEERRGERKSESILTGRKTAGPVGSTERTIVFVNRLVRSVPSVLSSVYFSVRG